MEEGKHVTPELSRMSLRRLLFKWIANLRKPMQESPGSKAQARRSTTSKVVATPVVFMAIVFVGVNKSKKLRMNLSGS